MNLHQVLSGACNAGDRCFAVGSVEGVPFTAYAAGCNIVILASTFERVQIIPGAIHNYIKISTLDCSTDTGKIAACYEDKVCIFEPTPLVHSVDSAHNLDYKWIHTGTFTTQSSIRSLSWNLEGTRLLTAGEVLQMWRENRTLDEQVVTFEIGGDSDIKCNDENSETITWECIWTCCTAQPVFHMTFSPDGTLFATCGKNDRLVKIWYENKNVLFPSNSGENYQTTEKIKLDYSFMYIAHPRAVTYIAWRKTSKYMPKGSVSNVLVTSCIDNICRVWVETVLPDDGLINMDQFDPMAAQNPKFRTHRHKHRFMQRLKHMKTCFHIRRHVKNGGNICNNLTPDKIGNKTEKMSIRQPLPSLPSTYSVHDFHTYGYHGAGVSPGMHFHLAASINAETDIPLVPSMQSFDNIFQPNFILHWLNNKEMNFTLQAEIILQELTQKLVQKEIQNSDTLNHNISNESETSTIIKDNTFIDSVDCDEKQNLNDISENNWSNSLQLADSLDMKIDSLLRDWHQSPDLLFSVHPIDGSFLIWIIEWLDDYYPGSFRQAQVSFSTRIPAAFSLGDAMSMSTTASLYHTGSPPLYFKEIVKNMKKTIYKDSNSIPEEKIISNDDKFRINNDNCSNSNDKDYLISSPIVSMVSKHSNGSLNLWRIAFADQTKFTQVLNVAHVSRASGHRFRVNDITCHPVLPLLLTTSHHNLTDINTDNQKTNLKETTDTIGFCSELILWRVDTVGPLSHSGGLSELARINSPEISAFSNVAWIPTLLPSTTLGKLSNSSSACFVASDGKCLRVYQAVIDARTLLAELSCKDRLINKKSSSISLISSCSSEDITYKAPIHDRIKIVSQQSTSKPGCIIQLDSIVDATHDWQNTQFLHVFQEQLITGEERKINLITKTSDDIIMDPNLNAIVDLNQNTDFAEPFYIVIIEKATNGSTIHMWRIVISSKIQNDQSTSTNEKTNLYSVNKKLCEDKSDIHVLLDDDVINHTELTIPQVLIQTKKVCTQKLPLPADVEVVHASPAAGHLSSSSIYPACFAPYIIVTACSDSISRFWKCYPNNNLLNDEPSFDWKEWKMFSKKQISSIQIIGQPLNISAAYSGRIACAYKYGKSFTRPNMGDCDTRYVNLAVAIYECESTGGSEWILEDTINLKNVHLPKIQLDMHVDMSYLHDNRVLQKKQRVNKVLQSWTNDDIRSSRIGDTTPEITTKPCCGMTTVPSFSTLQSLRKSITENGNTCPLTQKHLVQLDWVSKEDGSHILTVAVGNKILLYTSVSSDLAQANIKAMKESQSANRPLLRKASSLVQPNLNGDICWMILRQIELHTADDLPPLPMQISWVRDGILVVGMDSEMHVYSQWKPKKIINDITDYDLNGKLQNTDSKKLAQFDYGMKKNLTNVSSMQHFLIGSYATTLDKKQKKNSQFLTNVPDEINENKETEYMPDYGLFQASRLACPVLPQYHPKQLMEFLNSGKISWVKAILAHLVRCLNSTHMSEVLKEENTKSQRGWSRSRTLSFSCGGSIAQDIERKGSLSKIPEEITLDYAEIVSVPPLPLWVLLSAKKDNMFINKKENQGKEKNEYSGLFNSEIMDDQNENESELYKSFTENTSEDRNGISLEEQNITYFGTRQGQILSRLLTHTHLPGLSSLDQMHLLALADTMASCTVGGKNSGKAYDFIDQNSTGRSSLQFTEGISTDSLDDCGLRFLLAMKHYNYLLRCLPITQRNNLQKQGVGTSNIVWAYHSESEEELMNIITAYCKGEQKWATLRELGVGWWLRSNKLLKQCIEKVAKSSYQLSHDPLDAAIYYLAMKKKSIVWGLFRSQKDEKMTEFFSHNFSDNRWRKAALKNAFVLLGKQRFDHAAAFFLLAGSLDDAIEVCLNKLHDIQLALVITRLYEGELDSTPQSFKELLCKEILGFDKNCSNQNLQKANPDPFLRSIAYWTLKNYLDSLNTLLLCNIDFDQDISNDESISFKDQQGSFTNPNVFNFYIFLRNHPLLLRQQIASNAQENKASSIVLSGFCFNNDKNNIKANENELYFEDIITSLERRLYFTTAHNHFKAGCPALALEVLSKLPSKILQSSELDDNEISINKNVNNLKKASSEDLKELPNNDKNKERKKLDIMAQQLKFVACLKILMEELSTLATGFEVDGGQLRFHLYVWLERVVDALKNICNYNNNNNNNRIDFDQKDTNLLPETIIVENNSNTEEMCLHEILQQEKREFEAKNQKSAKRRYWLKANETLLRTLLSYCSLHGASGGGLASVRMELVLLLQELQQEKTQQQLLSPLPFPTMLPLLSACIADNKTVIADPIQYLKSHIFDILQTIISLHTLPIAFEGTLKPQIFTLKDLSIALSSCIYQCLCDSENFIECCKADGLNLNKDDVENITKLYSARPFSGLIINTQRKLYKNVLNEPLSITTSPSKWPGVASLRALLASEKDEDIPKLNVFLLEAFLSTFISLLVYALSTCDCHILYRLVGHTFTKLSWSTIFGGGTKRLLHKTACKEHSPFEIQNLPEEQSTPEEESIFSSLNKQRVKLNLKLLGNISGKKEILSPKESKKAYREEFVPPKMSIFSYLLTKPENEADELDYDTENSSESDIETEENSDVFQDNLSQDKEDNTMAEHLDPRSLGWCIMRLAIVKLTEKKLTDIILVAGIELQDLPVVSPLSHGSLQVLTLWEKKLRNEISEKRPPPENFIPGCSLKNEFRSSTIDKYKFLLSKKNTPFRSSQQSAALTRRLWHYLVQQEEVQDIFVRAIFSKKAKHESFSEKNSTEKHEPKSPPDIISAGSSENINSIVSFGESIRIIHKDQEPVSAFCINSANPGLIAFATPRQIQEMDITLLLDSPSWYEDEFEYDTMALRRNTGVMSSNSYLVINPTADRSLAGITSGISDIDSTGQQQGIGTQSGRGTTVILRHKMDNIKRMAAHPLLPFYITGAQDGSVQLWEWGHQQAVCTARPPGTFAKVTRCRFSQHGNKFGISDGDGNLSLWQAGLTAQSSKSFYSNQCHSKGTSDFVFLNSCSLIASAGHCTDNKNVAIWDTLLPQKTSLVTSFICHDQGSSSLIYAPQHQLLISSGKKGDICIFDMRQRTLRERFQAHDSAIRCIAIDPNEEMFITGSADGDIKIWGLSTTSLLCAFPGEHAKGSFFKHLGQGVSQIHIDSYDHLLSCGSDGIIKVRELPEREMLFHSI